MPRHWRSPPVLQASLALHGAAALGAVLEPGSWPMTLGAVVANHALLTAVGLWPRSNWLGPNWTCLPQASADRQEIALTLDDGPDPEVTPRVLDLLDQGNIKASFFCIGWRARRNPALCREIVARGHRIENHGDAHSWAFSTYGPGRMKADISAAQATLADITGQAPRFFRPTAGLRNPFLEPVLCDLDLQLACWSRRAYDTRESRAAVVLARLQKNLTPGDILLMHDGHGARTSDGQPVILQALPVLLDTFISRQLRPVTLADAIP